MNFQTVCSEIPSILIPSLLTKRANFLSCLAGQAALVPAVWGLDLVDPLQKSPGGYTHLLVAIDKFSKWIEVRPLNSIRSEQAVASD